MKPQAKGSTDCAKIRTRCSAAVSVNSRDSALDVTTVTATLRTPKEHSVTEYILVSGRRAAHTVHDDSEG